LVKTVLAMQHGLTTTDQRRIEPNSWDDMPLFVPLENLPGRGTLTDIHAGRPSTPSV
jgi:hypothetical protein